MTQEKRRITISEVLRLLEEGMTRKEINEYYQLNPRTAKELWRHPKLVNKRPSKYKLDILIVDDIDDEENFKDSMEENFGDSIGETLNMSEPELDL